MEKTRSEPLHTIITRMMFSQQVLFTVLVIVIIAVSTQWGARIAIQQTRQSTLLIANNVSDFLYSSEHALSALAVSEPTQTGLDSVRAGFNEFDVIYYILPNGRLSKVSPRNSLITAGMDMTSQPYITLDQGISSISSSFTSPRTGKATVYMGVPLLHGNGVIIGEVNLSQLQSKIIDENSSTTGSSYIIDQNGYYIAHPDSEKVARHEDIRQNTVYEAIKSGVTNPIYTWEDTLYVSIIQKIPSTEWFAITQTPVWIVYGPSLLPALISLIIALVLIIIGMRRQRRMISRRVIEPLELLAAQAHRITAGDYLYIYSQPVAPDAYAEVNLLMESFKTMEDAVRTRESDNYKLLFDVQRHLRQERLLRDIDDAITSIVSLDHTLKTVVTRINNRLGIDASSIYLYQTVTKELQEAYKVGFTKDTDWNQDAAFEKLISKRAEEGKFIHIPNLDKAKPQVFKTISRVEKLQSYIGIPLYAREQLIGYMNLFTRSTYSPSEDEIDFLKLVGTHTALAIDSTRLFNDLQVSNLEMAKAYDSTLEGWSRAMDLRDRETEGHTLRVTELTERLARKMGISDEHLVHIRRGSLLHDIGKIGVPDSILLKSGPLTSAEWKIMRRHPQYARDFLMAIEYLHPAVDIPVHHHERWDGNGYPDRLAGETIPLAARIFSVIDVWDALTSDRPYRSAWAEEKVLEYIREESGKYFDPGVVREFLNIIE
jgi:HD-GYP domain-containing protein (c-di-GMP phosphodiesterase class II)/HAMP domain-containing protein